MKVTPLKSVYTAMALLASSALSMAHAQPSVTPEEVRAIAREAYLYRMGAAVLGIYGNSKGEAVYPIYNADEENRKLDGSYKYELRFALGQLPPIG
ncbi:hypothetical protein [Pseudomonas arsenicoxydans]|uniref:hypothetical protein n=1 Tax=Pseudomonas arsenicoxydans TaxID=702115 RepID=UPI001877D422|nr:hypothetical protein [Pseudomonas arsenicoxydans]